MDADQSPFFKWSNRILKYFLLFLFGFTLVCIVPALFGIPYVAELLVAAFGTWLLRIAGLVFLLMAIAIVFESIRY